VGLIAIGLLSFYFYFGYQQFQEVTDPNTLIKIGKDQLNQNLAEVRSVAAQHIRESAPQWAEELSSELLKQMPTARAEIENQLRIYINTQFQDAKTITQQQFRQMIKDNRADIQTAIDTISNDKESQAFMDAFMPVVEKTIAIDVHNNAAEALGAFEEMNDRLDRLAKGENLNGLEKQQRYLLGLVQRLRTEETELK
jgi:F0F1-type ATP synthase membrane subunit b/b'